MYIKGSNKRTHETAAFKFLQRNSRAATPRAPKIIAITAPVRFNSKRQ
jgi:hypothetical protein